MFVRSSGKRYLAKWVKESSVEGFGHFVVKRRFDATDIFVDLYWSISEKGNHENHDSIYQRVSWERLETVLESVENNDLPDTLAYLENKRKHHRE